MITGRQRVALTALLLIAAVVLYVVGKDTPAACILGVAMGQFGPALGAAAVSRMPGSRPPPAP